MTISTWICGPAYHLTAIINAIGITVRATQCAQVGDCV
jgi:hypothetical protein